MDIERVRFPPTGYAELKGPNEGDKKAANTQREVIDGTDSRPHPHGSRGWHLTQCHPNGCEAGEGSSPLEDRQSYYEILRLNTKSRRWWKSSQLFLSSLTLYFLSGFLYFSSLHGPLGLSGSLPPSVALLLLLSSCLTLVSIWVSLEETGAGSRKYIGRS